MEYRLTPELLLRAYTAGLFPMGEARGQSDIVWVDPEWRGIIPLDGFHLPRRLRRTVRNAGYSVRVDSAFGRVMQACAAPRRGRRETWINAEILRAYAELHRWGFAHSVECWAGAEMVGGLYGVAIAGAFFGESMFARATDASKIALVHLVARLDFGGYRLLDTQFLTDHLARFGAIEVSRQEYRDRLEAALSADAEFPETLPEGVFERYLQSFSQTS